jgi:polysaccharide biosynthesis PFTS motif protein
MIRKSFFLLIIERLYLLFNRQVTCEFAMQEMHDRLLKEHFYLNFRLKTDSLLETLRVNHNNSQDSFITTNISRKDICLAANQKLILRTINSSTFRKAIVYYKTFDASIWFPLNREFREQFSQLGLRFNRPICSLLLVLFHVLATIKSVTKLLRHEIGGLRSTPFPVKTLGDWNKKNPNIFLYGVDKSAFPNLTYKSHNFLDWLVLKFKREYFFFHNCPEMKTSKQTWPQIQFQHTVVPNIAVKKRLASYFSLIILIVRYVFNPQLKVFDMLTQVDEILVTLQLSKNANTWSYDYVIFPSSVLIVQPLWSIFLERAGVKVILVNYTAMAEPVSPHLTRVVDGIWHLSTWKDTWVVDEQQASQMRLTSRFWSENYSCVGVPYWSGRVLDQIPHTERGFIAVFDTFIRSNQVFAAGVVDEMGWNDPKLAVSFIELTLQVATRLNLVVLHKKKRKVPEAYRAIQDRITPKLKAEYGEHYQVIDESFSVESLVSLSVAVVSKPISTTALIATEMGKLSIVFDPTMNTQPNDPGLRNCKLVYTADQLFQTINGFLDG